MNIIAAEQLQSSQKHLRLNPLIALGRCFAASAVFESQFDRRQFDQLFGLVLVRIIIFKDRGQPVIAMGVSIHPFPLLLIGVRVNFHLCQCIQNKWIIEDRRLFVPNSIFTRPDDSHHRVIDIINIQNVRCFGFGDSFFDLFKLVQLLLISGLPLLVTLLFDLKITVNQNSHLAR